MNDDPFLLCIIVPTYNRAPHLARLLSALKREVQGMAADIQFVIGDNASEDATQALTADFAHSVPNVTVIRHASNVGPDENFCSCIERSMATYFWIIGDDDLVRPGVLQMVVLPILTRFHPDLLYLASGWSDDAAAAAAGAPALRAGDAEVTLRSPFSFASHVNVWVTYISGMIVRADHSSLQSNRRYTGSYLVQLGWVLPALSRPDRCFMTVEEVCLFSTAGNTGGYRLLTVFGKNFLEILRTEFAERPELASRIRRMLLWQYLPGLVWMSRTDAGGRFHSEQENPLEPLRHHLAYWIVLRPMMAGGRFSAPAAHLLSRVIGRLLRLAAKWLDKPGERVRVVEAAK